MATKSWGPWDSGLFQAGALLDAGESASASSSSVSPSTSSMLLLGLLLVLLELLFEAPGHSTLGPVNESAEDAEEGSEREKVGASRRRLNWEWASFTRSNRVWREGNRKSVTESLHAAPMAAGLWLSLRPGGRSTNTSTSAATLTCAISSADATLTPCHVRKHAALTRTTEARSSARPHPSIVSNCASSSWMVITGRPSGCSSTWKVRVGRSSMSSSFSLCPLHLYTPLPTTVHEGTLPKSSSVARSPLRSISSTDGSSGS
mmetsp:Transcript_38110/g.71459  ORF Transcript_38110/g.71459 Transcript_38110/m.71459 type:complete len:261 (-) Transcript_38110:386-1168(-)